ncbi:hypothetical protein [Streptomyces sp. NPDC002573]|uniref:hypothetical protein n=1 Tax=Streptomyces sp. NPDC002573 TaxID=3364651 RepID=UPI00369DA0B8
MTVLLGLLLGLALALALAVAPASAQSRGQTMHADRLAAAAGSPAAPSRPCPA